MTPAHPSAQAQPPSRDAQPAPVWRPTLIALGLLTVTLFVGYWETLSAMAVIWARSETYTHGFLVPPIALWLVWRERAQLAQHQPSSTPWLILPLALIVFVWLLGELTAVNALTQFAVVVALILGIMTLLGLRLSARLAFPLIFLLFAVPVGDFMMPQLMEWTANFTILALRASGIPVYREGLQFVIPSGSWSVVEACSGIRYIIASLTVGTLFAYLNYSSLKRRLIFILVSLLVPIVANWLRAYMIVMIGHLSSNQLAAGADHLIYGWVFFGLVMIIMFMIGMRWSEPPSDDIPSPQQQEKDAQAIRTPWPATIALLLILAAGPLAFGLITQRGPSGTPVLSMPPIGQGWVISADEISTQASHAAANHAETSQPNISEPSASSSESGRVPVANWQPAFANPSASLQTRFQKGEQTVGLYLGYYRDQNFERKLVSSTNVLVTSKDPDWSRTANGRATVNVAGSALTVRTSELRHKGSATRLRVWQWYWINGQLTSSDIEAKLYTAFNRLLGKGDDSAVIIVYAPQEQGAAANQVLTDFVTVNGEILLKNLNQTRNNP